MAKPQPLVQVATLCESIITEPDKVSSIIRSIDTVFLVRPPEVPADVVLAVGLKIFISLKSGDVRGEYDVLLRLRTPDGKAADPTKWHVRFLGGESGETATIDFQMPVREYGLYWYDVLWDGEILTSIPIKLVEGPKPDAAVIERKKSVIR